MSDDLEKNYKKLKESEKIRRSLTNILVHDLGNPLTAISGGIQLVQMEGEERLTNEQKKNLEIAAMAAEELRRMVNGLLGIGKIEEGTLKPNYENFEIGSVAGELVEKMGIIARYDEKAISVKAQDNLPAVCADKELIKQVIATLINNAIRFTPPQGSIVVEMLYRDKEKDFCVQVKDEGAKIPKAHLGKIFDKLVQVETQNEIKINYGLGLTFCKMIVELHGGKVWATNGANNGNCLAFTLPQNKI